MTRPANPAPAGCELPPLFRSEGFAEDLPDWADADQELEPPHPGVQALATWLMGAPLALALVGAVSSLAVLV